MLSFFIINKTVYIFKNDLELLSFDPLDIFLFTEILSNIDVDSLKATQRYEECLRVLSSVKGNLQSTPPSGRE